MSKIAIAICCERGELEKLTIILIKSLFRFSDLKDKVEIISFSPRKNFQPQKKTLDLLEMSGVSINTSILNVDYPYYPLYNKPLVSSYLEQKNIYDYILFLDSDLLILNKFSVPEVVGKNDIALQCEFKNQISALNEQDHHFSYWSRLFSLLNAQPSHYCHLFTSGKKVIGYYNSGLIISKGKTGLMEKWKNNLTYLLKNFHWRNLEYFFLEQATLSVTIHQMNLKVTQLNRSFNYPISLHEEIISDNKAGNIKELSVCHYLKEYEKMIDSLVSISSPYEEKLLWVKEQFEEHKIFPKSSTERFIDFVNNQHISNLQKALYFRKKFFGSI